MFILAFYAINPCFKNLIMKRVFLIVLDSLGVGELPDAKSYNDEGSNTLKSIMESELFYTPNLAALGLFNIDGICDKNKNVLGAYGRLAEKSCGKDTTIGHWEIAGLVSNKPLPTYPNGFPVEIIQKLEQKTGCKVICNKPYSGTKVILDYGEEHIKTGSLIVYTSADSVLQIAAHEDIVPIEKLYEYCKIAREIMQGEHAVGRIIARPFTGDFPDFVRTSNRHDFSLVPSEPTMLTELSDRKYDVIGVGKINDIFAGVGLTKTFSIKDNSDGMDKTFALLKEDFEGLCFVNLVDFDMKFGHRNDVNGYANALSDFDIWLGYFLQNMKKEDLLILTSDHGCDPKTQSTDHSREYTFVLAYGKPILRGVNLGTRQSFSDISATILDYFNVKNELCGESFLPQIENKYTIIPQLEIKNDN